MIDRPDVASDDDKRRAFDEWHDHLYWTALLITGSREEAEHALVDATELSKTISIVFRDWLMQWSRDATSQMAVKRIYDQIQAASATYERRLPCSQLDHPPLTLDQIETIRQIPMKAIHAALDSLARAVLVLRGIKRDSIGDCVRVLRVPRERVIAAYCAALHWVEQSHR